LVDTVIFSRAPEHIDTIKELMQTSPDAAAQILGMPAADLPTIDDFAGMLGISDSLQAAAMAQAINEAWMLLGGMCLLAFPILWWMGHVQSALPLSKLAQSLKEGQTSAL
jgi:MFS transporter, DHA2 family, multidrug resistance protein